jgi:hypothetical protein
MDDLTSTPQKEPPIATLPEKPQYQMRYGNIFLTVSAFPLLVAAFQCVRAFFDAETHTVRTFIWLILADVSNVVYGVYKHLNGGGEVDAPMWVNVYFLATSTAGMLRIFMTLQLIAYFEEVYQSPGAGWVLTSFAVYITGKAVADRWLVEDKASEKERPIDATDETDDADGKGCKNVPASEPTSLRGKVILAAAAAAWIPCALYGLHLCVQTTGTDRLAVLLIMADLTILFHYQVAKYAAGGDGHKQVPYSTSISSVFSVLAILGMFVRWRLFFSRWTMWVKTSVAIFAAVQASAFLPLLYKICRDGTFEASVQAWMSQIFKATKASLPVRDMFMKQETPQYVKDCIADLRATCEEIQQWNLADETPQRWRTPFSMVESYLDDDLFNRYIGGGRLLSSYCKTATEQLDWLQQNGESTLPESEGWEWSESKFRKQRLQRSAANIIEKLDKVGV